jgi:hypothetical protein
MHTRKSGRLDGWLPPLFGAVPLRFYGRVMNFQLNGNTAVGTILLGTAASRGGGGPDEPQTARLRCSISL